MSSQIELTHDDSSCSPLVLCFGLYNEKQPFYLHRIRRGKATYIPPSPEPTCWITLGCTMRIIDMFCDCMSNS